MEATLWQALATVLTLLVTSSLLWYLVWRPYAVTSWYRRQGIRGPAYRFVVGSLPDCKRMLAAGRAKALDASSHDCVTTVQPFFRKWASDYGKTFLFWLGPIPALCCTDMDLVKQVFTDRTDLFEKDYMNPSLEAILGSGVIFANGDDWKRRRKFVHPAFNQEMIKSLSTMASEYTQDMMDGWCAKMKEGKAEIDMRHDSYEIAVRVIAQVMLGEDYKEAWEVFVASKELAQLATYAFGDPPIPGFRYLPTRRNRRTWKLDGRVKSRISHIIEKRLAGGVYGDDLLGLMLQACRTLGETLSTTEMIGECKSFFAAGSYTSASFISWAMFLLATYPHWQEMVREEVVRESSSHNGDLGKLKLLNMLLLETLRLYSPIAYLQKKTGGDAVLGNIKVPKGTILVFPQLMLHRDKEVWGPDADQFNPMRFQNGVSVAAKHSHAFLAFGYGPRICAGQNFAIAEAQTVIAMVLRSFSFTLSPKYKHKPTNRIALMPSPSLPLIVTKLHLDG